MEELILCPTHKKPCSLKTGTKPGPNKGKSFYLCMEMKDERPCDFVQETSFPPKSCSAHPDEFVELQRVVFGKQSGEQRCYYRCGTGRSNKTWCGHLDRTLQAKSALKDYNFQDRKSSSSKPESESSKNSQKLQNPTADTNKTLSEIKQAKTSESNEKASPEKQTVTSKQAESTTGKESELTEKSKSGVSSNQDASERSNNCQDNGSEDDSVIVLEESSDDDDSLPSFHSLAKRTPKSKPMVEAANSSFTSYRDRGPAADRINTGDQNKSSLSQAEVTTVSTSPVDALTSDVGKLVIQEENPFLGLPLDKSITKKRDILSALQKNRDIARKVGLSALPDNGKKLTNLIESLAKNVRLLDKRIAKGQLPSVDYDTENAKPQVQVIKVEPEALTTDSQNQVQQGPLSQKGPQVFKVMPDGTKVMMNSGGHRQTSVLQHAVPISPHELQQMYASNPQAMQLYGGRMTTNRLREVTSITKEALEKLHKQIESCPPETEELEDPKGLQVPLMTHQKQALTWLSWREKQNPCGGILADDMGLGKTLTMISHTVKQREMKESATDEEKSTWLNRDKELEKMNADVVPSNTTLVVCPASLIYQWQKEIEKRTRPGLLRVEVYHGPNREKNILKLAKYDIVLTTYNIVSKEVGIVKGDKGDEPVTDEKQPKKSESDEKPEPEPMLLRIGWERVILDEAHNIKNHKSLTAMSVCRLRANFRWALTGTPIQNDLLDMYSLLRYLRCSPFDEFKVWKRHVDTGKSAETKKLNTIVRSLLLRRTKGQTGKEGKPLVNLPTKSIKTYNVDLTSDERKIYERVFKKTKSTVENFVRRHEEKEMGLGPGGGSCNPFRDQQVGSSQGGAWHSQGAGFDRVPPVEKKPGASELLVLLLRLRQCCCHLSLMREHIEQESIENDGIELTLEEQMKGMQLEGELGGENGGKSETLSPMFEKSATSTKMTELMSKLHDIRQEKDSGGPRIKSVVVSQWTKMLDIVAHHLNKMKISYNVIKGSIPPKKRNEMVEEFNTNPRGVEVMLVSLKAGGVGLNLIGGNHLFLLDNHWNPALEEQAFDRVYRVGQKRDVVIHKFLCKDTIEEKIVELQKRKLTLAKNVLSGSGAKSQKLTLADLREMFNV